ncbi:MAG: phage tail sheath subtilisin-like domain-containing protein [Acidobacteriota bacterium]|nr:phage tail sheath subtilisin-like domain-containing protein [Acidobacteriota bacterium]
MPVTPTYPGVYIEEVASGVHTITGVATSIAAFVGRALSGPVDDPTFVDSFAEFERRFGGLWGDSSLGFAVRDFFQNGGGQAIVVRIYKAESGANPKPGTAELDANNLPLQAASPGEWGNTLRARIDTKVSEDVANALGLAKARLFNLTVRDTRTGDTEQFLNVSIDKSARQVKDVVGAGSRLVQVKGDPNTLPTAHGDPPACKTVWEDDTASSKVADAKKASNGMALDEAAFIGGTNAADKLGLYALEKADLFNILCIPPFAVDGDLTPNLVGTAAAYCETRRAMLLVDPQSGWDAASKVTEAAVSGVGTNSKNAALFFPRLRQPNPGKGGALDSFVACGAVAGIFARTDAQRGVWKAPAGLEATLVGVPELSVSLTDGENGRLNPIGVNCLRVKPGAGRVVWGARTLQGNDILASEWKYIPVRRLALFLEESLYRGTQWVVFEPNDEPLWAQIRLNVGAFLHNLFRQGAFQGKTPQEAYFVRCDKTTTTQNDINLGIVNILVGFAPLKPAEFVFVKIQQIAGQIEV